MSSIYRVNYQMRPHRRDTFIEFIKALLLNPFILHASQQDVDGGASGILQQGYAEVMERLEKLIIEHIKFPQQSHLLQLVPTINSFFTALPLKDAFLEFDRTTHLSARRFVPPSFNDIRHILNVAQIMAISSHLQLITFDGDQTLYADGMDFANDDALVTYIVRLLKRGLRIAVVTAAGYPNDPKRYEQRLSGLLSGFRAQNLEESVLNRFFVLGGECNFLFQCVAGAYLQSVPNDVYFTPTMMAWNDQAVSALLDIAEKTFTERVSAMGLNGVIVRKLRGVGIIPKPGAVDIPREQLDEVVLAAQYQVTKADLQIPFCAFNGGRDAWVDVGNKLLGVQALQAFFNIDPSNTLHVGDQFLSTGNDIATRSACCTLWVTNPDETRNALRTILEQIGA